MLFNVSHLHLLNLTKFWLGFTCSSIFTKIRLIKKKLINFTKHLVKLTKHKIRIWIFFSVYIHGSLNQYACRVCGKWASNVSNNSRHATPWRFVTNRPKDGHACNIIIYLITYSKISLLRIIWRLWFRNSSTSIQG